MGQIGRHMPRLLPKTALAKLQEHYCVASLCREARGILPGILEAARLTHSCQTRFRRRPGLQEAEEDVRMRKVHSSIRHTLIERLESRALLSSGPVITTQPVSQVFVTQGDSATFTAAAGGDPAPTVQWEVSVDGITAFAPITNNGSATTDTLIVPDVQINDQTNQYEAVFTNSAGTAATMVSTLYVEPANAGAPAITTQPLNQNLAAAGDSATFIAAASGTPTPTVQWYVKSPGTDTFTAITDNSSATTTTLTLSDVSASFNGNQYQAVFTNTAGTATTNPATLSVPLPPFPAPPSPSASLTASPLRHVKKFYFFTVTYTGASPIDTSTFDIHNVLVTGPDGYEEAATFISFTPSRAGETVAVTYRVEMGSQWTSGNNGKYHVYVRGNQVKDTNGNFVAGGILGPFKVLIG